MPKVVTGEEWGCGSGKDFQNTGMARLKGVTEEGADDSHFAQFCALQKKLNMDRYALAERLGVTPRTVWNWERDKCKIPKAALLVMYSMVGAGLGNLLETPSRSNPKARRS